MKSSENSSSGWGRLFLDPAKQHDDIRLLRRAIRERWNIDDEFRQVAVERLKKIVAAKDDELALKAIAEVRHLVAQNQKDEHKVIDVRVQTRNDELAGIAADLGIEVGAIEDAARTASASLGTIEGEGIPEAQRR